MASKSMQLIKKRDDIASTVAEMYNVSPRYVRMVRDGERENEKILKTLIDLTKGKNKLIEKVKKTVRLENEPIKRTPKKYGDLK